MGRGFQSLIGLAKFFNHLQNITACSLTCLIDVIVFLGIKVAVNKPPVILVSELSTKRKCHRRNEHIKVDNLLIWTGNQT